MLVDRLVACCPCFETLASLAPQHEVVVFQQVRPHPEEATKWPSRRMGCNTDLRFPVLGRLERHADALVFDPDHPAWTLGDITGDHEIEFGGNAHRARDLECCAGIRNVADDAIKGAAAELDGAGFQGTLPWRYPIIL